MAHICFIPAFHDNYIWLITHPESDIAAVVDPGDGQKVINRLQQLNLTLGMILLTHHHADHSGGIPMLLKHYPDAKLFASSHSELSEPIHYTLDEGDDLYLDAFKLQFKVIAVPGHTKDHIAFYGHKMLFCGDTLFNGGCGRVFEGTTEQMYQALERFKTLDEDTSIYCAHEYTQANLRFCSAVEPNNPALKQAIAKTAKLRQQGIPTLPTTIGEQKSFNVFLRVDQPNVQHAAMRHALSPLLEPAHVFAALRQWKDNF